jgi:hypothetical protein
MQKIGGANLAPALVVGLAASQKGFHSPIQYLRRVFFRRSSSGEILESAADDRQDRTALARGADAMLRFLSFPLLHRGDGPGTPLKRCRIPSSELLRERGGWMPRERVRERERRRERLTVENTRGGEGPDGTRCLCMDARSCSCRPDVLEWGISDDYKRTVTNDKGRPGICRGGRRGHEPF